VYFPDTPRELSDAITQCEASPEFFVIGEGQVGDHLFPVFAVGIHLRGAGSHNCYRLVEAPISLGPLRDARIQALGERCARLIDLRCSLVPHALDHLPWRIEVFQKLGNSRRRDQAESRAKTVLQHDLESLSAPAVQRLGPMHMYAAPLLRDESVTEARVSAMGR